MSHLKTSLVNSNNYIKKYNIPNIISIGRLFTTLYLYLFVDYSDLSYIVLILIVSILGLSDAVDGYLARKYDAVTKFGTIVDPFVDRAVFIIILLWFKPLFLDIFFWGVLLRDGLVLIGSLFVLNKTKTINVSNLGKYTTVLLFVTICIHILSINITMDQFLLVLSYVSLFMYYYVALEYLYKQVLSSK